MHRVAALSFGVGKVFGVFGVFGWHASHSPGSAR
jgi:hypothetical protein